MDIIPLDDALRDQVQEVVDAVKGVMRCEAKDLEPAPRFGMQLNTILVQSIAKVDGAFVVILDTNQVFSEKELWLIKDELPAGGDAETKAS